MKICIGIISYLPDDPNERNIRINRLNTLLMKCDSIFKKDIVIVAQNWSNITLPKLKYSNIIIYSYNKKLGITGARKKLREKFLESKYDYLVMLDDDADLRGTELDGLLYLQQIESHPKMYGVFKDLLLKLFAISKEVYSLIDFPDLEPERGEIFEDMWLIMYLNKKHSDKKFVFKRNGLDDVSNSGSDIHSTWYKKQFHKRQMGDKTRAMIRSV